MTEFDTLIDRNFQALPDVFTSWMTLPAVPSLSQVETMIGSPDELEAHLADLSEQFQSFEIRFKYEQAILLPDRRLKRLTQCLSQNDLTLVRVFLLRSRASFQASYAVESGVYPLLEVADEDRSKVLISAGVDELKADLEIGVINHELVRAFEYFGDAGMGRLAFAIWSKLSPLERVQFLFPVPPAIESLENELLRGQTLNEQKLVLVPRLFSH